MHTYLRVILVVTAAATVMISGCTNNTTNPITPSGANFAPPTQLVVLSGDGSVWLKWKASSAKDSATFSGYLITATPVAGGTAMTKPVSSTTTSTEFSGLTAGTAYSFTIQSTSTDGSSGTASKAVVWAPAKFYNNIQLYSLLAPASSGRFSGLKMAADGVGKVSVALNKDSVDLVFDDRGGELDLLSPNLKSGTTLPRRTNILDATVTAISLTDFAEADSLLDTTNWVPRVAPLGTDKMGNGTAGKGETFFVRTQDGYYARVFVHGDATGKLYATDGTYKYITVDVSFQSNKNVIYSKPFRNSGDKSKD